MSVKYFVVGESKQLYILYKCTKNEEVNFWCQEIPEKVYLSLNKVNKRNIRSRYEKTRIIFPFIISRLYKR